MKVKPSNVFYKIDYFSSKSKPIIHLYYLDDAPVSLEEMEQEVNRLKQEGYCDVKVCCCRYFTRHK